MRTVDVVIFETHERRLPVRLADPVTGRWVDQDIPIHHAEALSGLKVGESVEITELVRDEDGRAQRDPSAPEAALVSPLLVRRVG
jgi:hypothetical protein